uniref:Uncharacterized protein n=1 Tax=Molossus molossus TaxID=27622 RepID=A0A7J8CRP1_MOLMO|nr:hypothetical protein HJG59_009731 [Molossus molossus]
MARGARQPALCRGNRCRPLLRAWEGAVRERGAGWSGSPGAWCGINRVSCGEQAQRRYLGPLHQGAALLARDRIVWGRELTFCLILPLCISSCNYIITVIANTVLFYRIVFKLYRMYNSCPELC